VATFAGRVDRYDTFGTSKVPMAGVIYQAAPSLLFKGTWGKSFRAPSLTQEYTGRQALLQSIPDPLSASGSSPVLFDSGGNASLRPETSTTKTFTVSYVPSWGGGANVTATYFNIHYRDKIENIGGLSSSPLTDPNLTPFIQRNPSPAQQAELLANAPFFNYTGAPYDPTTVAALFRAGYNNATQQSASGVDVQLNRRFISKVGAVAVSFDATYLDQTQTLTSASPKQQLTGTIFNPPRFRARANVNWRSNGWSAGSNLNYVGPSRDTITLLERQIASWTTVDVQAGYEFTSQDWLRGTRLLIFVQNLFDTNPPFVADSFTTNFPGMHYDSTNASPFGRFVSLELVKKW
jgi:outer membrane receptor for ferrienterochelin and colicin